MHIEINDSRNLRNLDLGISLIQAAWASFSPRLCSLTIVAPLDVISAIIPTSPTFISLEYLSLTLFAPPMCDDSTLSDSLAAHIKGFIDRHRRTLRSLDLSGRILKYTIPLVAKIDLGVLLVCLDHIIHLTSLAFNSAPSIDSTAVARFLDLHSKRLHNLDITLASTSDSNSREIPPTHPFLRHIQVPIPDLNTLSLDFADFSQCCWAVPTADVLQDYIGQYSFSLTSFKLLRAMLSRKHALALFDPKGCFGPALNLRHMVIGLESLTPEILHLISTTLPNLYELEVRFYAFRGNGDRDHPTEKEEQDVSHEYYIELRPISEPLRLYSFAWKSSAITTPPGNSNISWLFFLIKTTWNLQHHHVMPPWSTHYQVFKHLTASPDQTILGHRPPPSLPSEGASHPRGGTGSYFR